jgi:hypothetical protein
MKDLEATILDVLAYLVPGASCALAVCLPLAVCGLIPWPELSVGDALVGTLVMYMLGVLCSTLRPRRFARSPTGTKEESYDVRLGETEFRANVDVAVKHFCGQGISLEPWNKEKHFMLRFLVENYHKESGDFIRRQSALRQLRYNTVAPLYVFGINMSVISVFWFTQGESIWTIIPQVVVVWAGVLWFIRALVIAAHGNTQREVLYVFAAMVALYWKERQTAAKSPTIPQQTE